MGSVSGTSPIESTGGNEATSRPSDLKDVIAKCLTFARNGGENFSGPHRIEESDIKG